MIPQIMKRKLFLTSSHLNNEKSMENKQFEKLKKSNKNLQLKLS